jgi:hypothetical protein
LDFYGRHAFKLSLVDHTLKDACRQALVRMLDLHDSRPPGQVHAPRIPGIILRDLELALQQLDREATDAAIEELRAGGHLDGQNLRFLDIRRREAFCEWAAIREEVDAGTILELRRPARITQALLRAVYQVELAKFEENALASDALAHFHEALSHLAPLLETREGMFAAEVSKLFMLKAAALGDSRLRDSVLEGSTLRGADKVYLQAIADLVERTETKSDHPLSRDEAVEAYLDGDKDRAFELLAGGSGGERRIGLLLRCALDLGTLRVAEITLAKIEELPPGEREALRSDPNLARYLERLEELYTTPDTGVPNAWLDWLNMVSSGVLDDNKATHLAQQGAEEWSLEQLIARPGDVAKLAEALAEVPEQQKQQLRFSLPHLQSFLFSSGLPEPPLKPLIRTLLEFYVFDDARSGNTWRAAVEMLGALVRCGVSDEEYSDGVDLLELLLEEGLPLDRVDDALDLLESLVLMTPGQSSTLRAAACVQGGLQRWWERLGRAQIELFNQLGRELGSGATLPLPKAHEPTDDEPSGFDRLEDKVVALYSLNERALTRVSKILKDTVTGVRVLTFHDKVGGSHALREAARTADVFVVVTGAAKHAATEFIEANREAESLTLRTHGKGSASLLRLLEESAHDGLF